MKCTFFFFQYPGRGGAGENIVLLQNKSLVHVCRGNATSAKVSVHPVFLPTCLRTGNFEKARSDCA